MKKMIKSTLWLLSPGSASQLSSPAPLLVCCTWSHLLGKGVGLWLKGKQTHRPNRANQILCLSLQLPFSLCILEEKTQNVQRSLCSVLVGIFGCEENGALEQRWDRRCRPLEAEGAPAFPAKLPFPPSRLGIWSIHSFNSVSGPVLGSEEAAVSPGLI